MSFQRTEIFEACIQEYNKFKRGYQPRSNLAKDENDDLIGDSHNIFTGGELLCYGMQIGSAKLGIYVYST
jgi:hypothetical protein